MSPLLGGGNSLYPPDRSGTWTGTYGSLLLCSKTEESVQISSVDYHYQARPLATQAIIREVPDAAGRSGSPGLWGPMLALKGRIGRLAETDMRSTSLEPPVGASFNTPCTNATKGRYTELITSMTVDDRGGWIDEITINYTSGGHDYRLSVDYDYAACGTGVKDQFLCPPDSIQRPGDG